MAGSAQAPQGTATVDVNAIIQIAIQALAAIMQNAPAIVAWVQNLINQINGHPAQIHLQNALNAAQAGDWAAAQSHIQQASQASAQP